MAFNQMFILVLLSTIQISLSFGQFPFPSNPSSTTAISTPGSSIASANGLRSNSLSISNNAYNNGFNKFCGYPYYGSNSVALNAGGNSIATINGFNGNSIATSNGLNGNSIATSSGLNGNSIASTSGLNSIAVSNNQGLGFPNDYSYGSVAPFRPFEPCYQQPFPIYNYRPCRF